MNLKEYAAQHAQGTQQAQTAQENTLDTIARLTQAEAAAGQYSFLSEQLEAAINAGNKPAAILQQITDIVFGPDSKQAAAVKSAEEKPAPLEMQIATVRAQIKAANRKYKQQKDLLVTMGEELDALKDRETELIQRSADIAGFDNGLLEVLTFYKLQQLEPTQSALYESEQLQKKYSGNPAAMAMLHSCLLFLQHELNTGRVQFDFAQRAQLQGLLQLTAGK